MALSFANLETEVYDHTGLDSNSQTRVDRWLNYTQEDIVSRWSWPFMRGRETIVTIPDYTTGTVAVTSGGTTVTGTNTVWTATHADGTYYVQFDGANDWYRVTTRNSGTEIIIATAYQGTDDLTASTYILRKFFYALSSTTDRIIDIRNWNTPMKLIQCDPRTLDSIIPNPQSTNSSYGYVEWGVNSSGNILITPYPFPSDARLFEIRTLTRLTDGTISVPNKYAHVMAWGAIAVGFAYLRKFNEAGAWSAKYEQRIAQMKQEYRLTEDYQPMLKSIDDGYRTTWQPLPPSYPVI